MELQYWLRKKLSGQEVELHIPDRMKNLHGLAVDDAINAHEAWLLKLEDTLRNRCEGYDPGIVADDTICEVGKWLTSMSHTLDEFPQYHTLVEAHRSFHSCAGSIIEDHKRGHFGDAIKTLRHDLVDCSNQVQIHFVELLIAIHNP